MKDQTLKQYSNMVAFCEATLREHFVMNADPIKVIGVAQDLGLTDLVEEFEQRLKDDQEIQDEIKAYHEPHLKTLGNH